MTKESPITRSLEIDGMSGDACVQKVTGALKDVHGVTTHSVKVGSASIASTQQSCDAACNAIGTAGYKARETTRASDTTQPARAASNLEHTNQRSHTQPTAAPSNAGQRQDRPVGVTANLTDTPTRPAPIASGTPSPAVAGAATKLGAANLL